MLEDTVIREISQKSRRQTVISVVILSMLMVIGVVVFTTQYQYNPAVLPQDAFLSSSTPDKASPQLLPHASFIPLPDGIKPLTEAELFDTSTLSDKINGKAELYLSASFTGLVCQRFTDAHAKDRWMEAFIYNMGNAQNAFAVFSGQRRVDAEPLDLAQYAYHTSNALFLIHGPYYIEIIASDDSAEVLASMESLAVTFMDNTPATHMKTTGVDTTVLFPEENMVPDSVVLISTDAFGYEDFDKIYTAEYQFNDTILMAYLSHRGTPAEAKEMASNYAQFLLNYGGKNIETQLPIKNAYLIEILGTYEIVSSHDAYLAGIREAASVEQAQQLAMRLYDRIHKGP
jgi:hypothetical protein